MTTLRKQINEQKVGVFGKCFTCELQIIKHLVCEPLNPQPAFRAFNIIVWLVFFFFFWAPSLHQFHILNWKKAQFWQLTASRRHQNKWKSSKTKDDVTGKHADALLIWSQFKTAFKRVIWTGEWYDLPLAEAFMDVWTSETVLEGGRLKFWSQQKNKNFSCLDFFC